MEITVNGEERAVDGPLTVVDLLERLGIGGPAAVEVNREVVPKRDHHDRLVQAGDRVEIVTLVGGG